MRVVHGGGAVGAARSRRHASCRSRTSGGGTRVRSRRSWARTRTSTPPGSRRRTDQGDVIELRYIEHNRRVERQTSFMNPILPADVDEVLDADAFVCVPITDYEVGQPTLRHIKENNSSAIDRPGRARPDEHADPQRRTPPAGMGRPGRVAALHRHPQDEPRGGELDVAAASRRSVTADPPSLGARRTARAGAALSGPRRRCGLRDPGRAWLRGLLPPGLRRNRRGGRRSDRGGERRGHDRRRRLVRRRVGLRLPRVPRLRGGLPVRQRDGCAALHRRAS